MGVGRGRWDVPRGQGSGYVPKRILKCFPGKWARNQEAPEHWLERMVKVPPTERLASGVPAVGTGSPEPALAMSPRAPRESPERSEGEPQGRRLPWEGGRQAGRPLWLAWSSCLRLLLLLQICLFCVLLPPSLFPLISLLFPSSFPTSIVVTVPDPSYPLMTLLMPLPVFFPPSQPYFLLLLLACSLPAPVFLLTDSLGCWIKIAEAVARPGREPGSV